MLSALATISLPYIDASPGYANKQTALDQAISPDTRRGLLASWVRERGAMFAGWG